MKAYRYMALLGLLLMLTGIVRAQSDIIEIDTLTGSATKTMPYNRPFTVKIQIDAEDVDHVYYIKKHRHADFGHSLVKLVKTDTANRIIVPEIPCNYYYVRKIGEKNFLFLTFADKYMLEPSSAYYIPILQKKLGSAVTNFFDNYYLSQYGPVAKRASALANAIEALAAYERGMQKIFGDVVFGYYTVKDFTTDKGTFRKDFDTHLYAADSAFFYSDSVYRATVLANSANMAYTTPNFDSLTFHQLLIDSSINKEVLSYLLGKDLAFNAAASDINTLSIQGRITALLNGAVSLDCVHCTPVNTNSNLPGDITKRIANIDASTNTLNNLKRVLFLLNPKSAAGSNIGTSITQLVNWINFLQSSKTGLLGLSKMRKGIESAITENIFDSSMFTLASMASGNSYLNFETRNKVLITPDFGITTSAITKEGKALEYGIVPYIGFHLNLMAVDKDIPFNSYKKKFRQRTSLMVGWSVVNMKQDSTYENFFEKSSLLVGAGYRFSNAIRVTTGAQFLFKFGKDAANNRTKKLQAFPFVGISFDFNVKQYLNGFTDLLSGIGKTKLPKPAPAINSPQ